MQALYLKNQDSIPFFSPPIVAFRIGTGLNNFPQLFLWSAVFLNSVIPCQFFSLSPLFHPYKFSLVSSSLWACLHNLPQLPILSHPHHMSKPFFPFTFQLSFYRKLSHFISNFTIHHSILPCKQLLFDITSFENDILKTIFLSKCVRMGGRGERPSKREIFLPFI